MKQTIGLIALILAMLAGLTSPVLAADSAPPRPGEVTAAAVLPPLPFAKASMDLPRFHKERPEVRRSQQSLPASRVQWAARRLETLEA